MPSYNLQLTTYKEKTFQNNRHKTSVLKNTFQKGLKYICESQKDEYFCTRNKAHVHYQLLKNNQKKICEIQIKVLPLPPAKH